MGHGASVPGHRRLIINAHSTGGLISALWAHKVRDQGLVDAMVLNSPWLDLQGSWLLRTAGLELRHAGPIGS